MILGMPLPFDAEKLSAPPWDPERDIDQMAELHDRYAHWVHVYAQTNQIPVADFRSAFLFPDGQVDRTLFVDGLHPNEEGHRSMADVLCRVLNDFWPSC